MPVSTDASKPEKSTTEMSLEEFNAWLAELDQDPPPPSAYPLCSNEGRCGFLEAYIWRGEVALFEAVNHIWNSLNEPKNLRCIYIGMAAGTGGSGKWALAKFLRRALRAALDYEGTQPWGPDYATIEEFHEASMRYFDADHAHYLNMVQKYADILHGEPGRHASPPDNIVAGPWPALPHERLRPGIAPHKTASFDSVPRRPQV